MPNLVNRGMLGLVAVIIAGCASPGFHVEGANAGDTQQCLYLANIDQTPVIDDNTILAKMKGRGGYKRIDLVNKCVGLRISDGFSYATSTQQLCIQDALRVFSGGGEFCAIKQIVTIDDNEAKGLLAKR